MALLEGLYCPLLTRSWPLFTGRWLLVAGSWPDESRLAWAVAVLAGLSSLLARAGCEPQPPDCHSQPSALSSTSCVHAAAGSQHSPLPVQSCTDRPQALEDLKVDTWQASDPSKSCCQHVQGAGWASQALQLPDLLPTALERQLEVQVWNPSCAAVPETAAV